MKKYFFLLILSLIVFCSGCKKILTDSVDIIQFNWKMKSITYFGHKSKIKEDDYTNDDAYRLVFANDSIFKLNTSVNITYGRFEIVNKGCIDIFSYEEVTQVAGGNGIDDILRENIPLITSYEVLDDRLIFVSENCQIRFEKE